MFDYIDNALRQSGVHPLQESKKTVERKPETKKIVSENINGKLKESEITFRELDSLIENAIKETANNIIKESVGLEDSQKLVQTEAIDRSSIGEKYTEQFMAETVDPIINTIGTLTEDAKLLYTIKDPSKVKGVSLPVYEVALTLESARRGALTLESTDFSVAVKESNDPTIMDLHGANAEANNKDGKVDEDEQTIAGLIDQNECDTYDMGEKGVKEAVDVSDVHQYEDFDDDMYEIEKGSEPKQPQMNDTKTPKSLADVKDYVGKPAADPNDGGNFPDETMPVNESSGHRLARILFGESVDGVEVTDDVEVSPSSDKNIKDYEGQEAGLEGKDAEGEMFGGDGSSDEAIIENQINTAKLLLGHIFKEYGVKDKSHQKAIVKEAIHYIFRYGVNNLFPATSDVANLVVEQNNLAEISGGKTSRQIVESTQAILTDLQEAEIKNKSNEYLAALSRSKELTHEAGKCEEEEYEGDKPVVEQAEVMKAINFITSTSLIERTRQAFRHRLHNFSEDAKGRVASHWVIVESNTSDTAQDLKKDITVRRFVTETEDMKEFFNLLKEDSPIYKPEIKKSYLKNDALTAACIYTEVVTNWCKLKESLYNGTSLESKFIALEAMGTLHETYKNLCSAMRNPSVAKNLIEGHSFRLQNLKEKVVFYLEGKKMDQYKAQLADLQDKRKNFEKSKIMKYINPNVDSEKYASKKTEKPKASGPSPAKSIGTYAKRINDELNN